MPHIRFILPYPAEGGSTRFRVEQYLRHIEEAGFSFAMSTFFDEEGFRIMRSAGRTPRKTWELLSGLRRRIGDLHRIQPGQLVFVHREAFPLGPPWFERRFVGRGAKLVYDFDDAVYLPKERAIHPWMNRIRRPGKTAEIVSLARVVIAGNDTLAEYARPHSDHVVVIPTPIDTDLFRPPPEPKSNVVPVIGWIGNPTGVPYLDPLRPVFRRLSEKCDILVRVIGGRWECPGVNVEWKQWQRDTEVEEIQGFDIGVMPLPDSPWTRGKCAFKLIQYMSCGKPVVASAVGMNRQVVRDGENGFLASQEDEWVEKLERLLVDPLLQEQFGRRGRDLVAGEYSVKALAPRLIAALELALSDRG